MENGYNPKPKPYTNNSARLEMLLATSWGRGGRKEGRKGTTKHEKKGREAGYPHDTGVNICQPSKEDQQEPSKDH
jgi:hypothetical protein